MHLHKSLLDYFEDDSANVMRVQEGQPLLKNKKPVLLGQTAHCSWVLTKGVSA